MDFDGDNEIGWQDFKVFMANEIAEGRNPMSGDYVLPSGLCLPLGNMIQQLTRAKVMREVMDGGTARKRWMTEGHQYIVEKVTNLVEAELEIEKRMARRRGKTFRKAPLPGSPRGQSESPRAKQGLRRSRTLSPRKRRGARRNSRSISPITQGDIEQVKPHDNGHGDPLVSVRDVLQAVDWAGDEEEEEIDDFDEEAEAQHQAMAEKLLKLVQKEVYVPLHLLHSYGIVHTPSGPVIMAKRRGPRTTSPNTKDQPTDNPQESTPPQSVDTPNTIEIAETRHARLGVSNLSTSIPSPTKLPSRPSILQPSWSSQRPQTSPAIFSSSPLSTPSNSFPESPFWINKSTLPKGGLKNRTSVAEQHQRRPGTSPQVSLGTYSSLNSPFAGATRSSASRSFVQASNPSMPMQRPLWMTRSTPLPLSWSINANDGHTNGFMHVGGANDDPCNALPATGPYQPSVDNIMSKQRSNTIGTALDSFQTYLKQKDMQFRR